MGIPIMLMWSNQTLSHNHNNIYIISVNVH